MDPMNFRNISIGIDAIKIIVYSEWVAFKQNKGLLLSMAMGPVLSYGLLVLALSTSLKTVNLEGVAILYKQYALTGVLTFFVTRQMSQAMYRATIDNEIRAIGAQIFEWDPTMVLSDRNELLSDRGLTFSVFDLIYPWDDVRWDI